jgi:hypothetical protein
VEPRAQRSHAPRQVDDVRRLVLAEEALNEDDARRPRQKHRRRSALVGAYACSTAALHAALALPAGQIMAADVRQAAAARKGAQLQQEERR